MVKLVNTPDQRSGEPTALEGSSPSVSISTTPRVQTCSVPKARGNRKTRSGFYSPASRPKGTEHDSH